MRLVFALLAAAATTVLASGSATAMQPGDTQNLFVSPAGEVFRQAPGGPPPMEAWFRQADANGDGIVGFLEFQADFRRAFDGFDTDHDGEIAPEEVAHYETAIFPEMATRGRTSYSSDRSRERRSEGGGETAGNTRGRDGFDSGFGGAPRRRGGGASMMVGAGRFGLLPIAHLIMEADRNFNRGVSRTEWEEAAASRFTRVDRVHNGRLTMEGLTALREHPPGD